MRAEHQVGHKQTCKKFIKQLLHGVDSGKLLDTDAEFRDPFGLYNNRDGAGKRRAHFVAKPIGFNMRTPTDEFPWKKTAGKLPATRMKMFLPPSHPLHVLVKTQNETSTPSQSASMEYTPLRVARALVLTTPSRSPADTDRRTPTR
jgi:hypothetical protein